MLPTLTQLNISARQCSESNAKLELSDLPNQMQQEILLWLQRADCGEITRLAESNAVFCGIFNNQQFWKAANEDKKWLVEWDTGLTHREYYQMMCSMTPSHRNALAAIHCNTEQIGEYAFAKKHDVAEVTIYSVDLSDSCTQLALKRLPNSVESIGDGAFMGCKSLAFTSLPNSLESIGDDAFIGCTSLKLVTLPDSLESIGCHAFMACTLLKLTELPHSLTTIGDWAFHGCTSLSIDMQRRIRAVNPYAF